MIQKRTLLQKKSAWAAEELRKFGVTRDRGVNSSTYEIQNILRDEIVVKF